MSPADRHVTVKHRALPLHNVDGGIARANVDERHNFFRAGSVIGLEHVLQGEIIHIHHHRDKTSLADRGNVAVEDVLPDRHQEHIDVGSSRIRVEHLVVEIYVIQALGNKVAGFEQYGLF